MTISNEQAETLIHLKKKIFQDDKVIDNLVIDQIFPLRLRYELVSNEDDDFSFLWEIIQSSKSAFRISLHFQEDESKIGLFRVDYIADIVIQKLPQKTSLKNFCLMSVSASQMKKVMSIIILMVTNL